MKKKLLSMNVFLILTIMTSNLQPAYAFIPVIDSANLIKNILSAQQAVTQTLQQIEQYKTQLEQYETQLRNTIGPAAYIWDRAQDTINKLTETTDTISYYQNKLGNLDSYLNKFQDIAYYRNSPCFSSQGCSSAEWALMKRNRALASESQKKANDALFKSLRQQQDNLKADATILQRLQSSAQSAKGQLAAIGYANQLASNQTSQLLQIRSLLVAQQNATATQMQAAADKEAQRRAASEQLRRGKFVPSDPIGW